MYVAQQPNKSPLITFNSGTWQFLFLVCSNHYLSQYRKHQHLTDESRVQHARQHAYDAFVMISQLVDLKVGYFFVFEFVNKLRSSLIILFTIDHAMELERC